MIEELKILLETITDISGIAGWIIGGFLSYKLIIFLTTSGAIIYCFKYGIDAFITWVTKPKLVEYTLADICISSNETAHRLITLLKQQIKPNLLYLHNDDIEWMTLAFKEKKARDLAKEINK